MMNHLKAMQSFVSVHDEGGFSAAGRNLGLSKTLVSKHISDLEEHLGTRLLNRTTRSHSLTESGQIYLDHCRNVLEQINSIEVTLADQLDKPTGTLRVSAPLSYGQMYLAPVLKKFMEQYPELTIDIDLTDRFVDIIEEGFDIALRIGGQTQTSFISRKLAETQLALFASPQYLEKHGTPKTAEDFKDHLCLMHSRGSARSSWKYDGQTVSPVGKFIANHGDMLRRIALESGGIIYLPDFFVRDDIAAGRLVQIGSTQDGTTLQLNAIYPHRQYLPLKVRVFIDFLADALKNA